MKVLWLRTIFSNGRHNMCLGNLVHWKGTYYLGFVDCEYHGSDDAQIGVISSTDLEKWDSHTAMGKTSFDPQLLPVGDRLLVYATTGAWGSDDFEGFSSWQMVASTENGKNWTEAQRCFVMNYDFWKPVEHEGKYYVAADSCGHVPPGMYATANLLTSSDGEKWSWVSEIIRGSEEYTLLPSEAALCFLKDGRLFAVIRTKAPKVILAVSEPPYREWEHSILPFSLQGPAAARVGDRVVVTGRIRDEDGRARTGVFEYADRNLERKAVLPSGGDTGYTGLLPRGDAEILVAYYSTHEYCDELIEKSLHGPADIYLASLSLS